MAEKDKDLSMNHAYELIDSGDNQKLERFGEKLIARPSSVCVWQQRLPDFWKKADAVYSLKNKWIFKGAPFSEWQVEVQGVRLKLKILSNGQLGFFPEHRLYLPQLLEKLSALKKSGSPRLLNLFAYTGLASYVAALAGAQVTHIDSSKKAITWAKENAQLNSIAPDRVRLLPEDAIKFLEREKRRGNFYDVILLDPPSFSRLSKSNSWTLEEILRTLTLASLDLLNAKKAAIFFTNHSSVFVNDIIRNLFLDYCSKRSDVFTEQRVLRLKEADSKRELPSGSLFVGTWGI
jgi:23S rRNA (cytosine1962-C5)-methyltransferase